MIASSPCDTKYDKTQFWRDNLLSWRRSISEVIPLFLSVTICRNYLRFNYLNSSVLMEMNGVQILFRVFRVCCISRYLLTLQANVSLPANFANSCVFILSVVYLISLLLKLVFFQRFLESNGSFITRC